MKEYKVYEVKLLLSDIERDLNNMAKDGWNVVCSFSRFSQWMILEREIDKCKHCGR